MPDLRNAADKERWLTIAAALRLRRSELRLRELAGEIAANLRPHTVVEFKPRKPR